ncbi:urease accessory protein UreF, partial [Streptomyces griseus]|uniref:urease accessory protein UreF n=1 Tax=Streptomyces griseus TaxID=1911 RepID=UPI003694AA08
MSRAALLVLADGRFPAGGHAHSGGAEPAVADGRVRDADSLADFCRGRLHTAGLTAAALAAAAAHGLDPLALDEAADARTPSPALRATARKLGRQMMRAARATWPGPELDALARARPRGAHQPVVLGLTARSAGLGPEDAAHCVAYETVSGPATAVVRLLSLDPFHATAVLARLAPDVGAAGGVRLGRHPAAVRVLRHADDVGQHHPV